MPEAFDTLVLKIDIAREIKIDLNFRNALHFAYHSFFMPLKRLCSAYHINISHSVTVYFKNCFPKQKRSHLRRTKTVKIVENNENSLEQNNNIIHCSDE